jgi:hypothetical protein
MNFCLQLNPQVLNELPRSKLRGIKPMVIEKLFGGR